MDVRNRQVTALVLPVDSTTGVFQKAIPPTVGLALHGQLRQGLARERPLTQAIGMVSTKKSKELARRRGG